MAISEQHLRTLWLRMGEIYGMRWRSAHGLADTNNTWLKGLRDLTPHMLAFGLQRCCEEVATKTWPPSLPDFRRYCLGLPEMTQAIQLAINAKPNSDPFILNMRDHIGKWELKNLSYYELERLAEIAYHSVGKDIILKRFDSLADPAKFDVLFLKHDRLTSSNQNI